MTIKTMARRDMKPGTIFGLNGRAMVVLDDQLEVDFWDGALYGLGDVAPGWDLPVISEPRKIVE